MAPEPARSAQNPSWSEWFWQPSWADWLLVLVGVSAAIVGLGSLEQLRRQVGANVDAANSAKAAADAAADATRIGQEQLKLSQLQYEASLRAAESAAESAAEASRFAQTEFKISKRAYVRVFAHVSVGEDGGRVFTCVLTNLGALPAKLDRLAYHSLVASEGLTAPPDFERIAASPTSVGIKLIDEAGQTLFPGENMIRNMPFAAPPAEFADLLPRDAEWFYGELRYRDVFDDAHKTRFCTRVENGELVSDGPPAYHECD